MFRVLYNQARVQYRIEPVTGLLIKTGKEAFDPTRPAMEFIRTWAEVEVDGRLGIREVPFLPGSSLKGIIRSHAERILRTLDRWTCDITQTSCTKEKEGKSPSYQEHCYACRTFGNTTLASHVRFTDAFPWLPKANSGERGAGVQKVHLEERPGVQIDRRKGTVAQGPFELEVVTAGAFYGEITLRNYQLWQLGLLALTIRDIDGGVQRVGALKSRGLGYVRMVVEEFVLEQYGPLAQSRDRSLQGIGAVPTLLEAYDLLPTDQVPLPEGLTAQSTAFSIRFAPKPDTTPSQAWQAVATAIIDEEPWRHFLEHGHRMPANEG